LAIPLNSEKLSLFSDSERSEESKALIIKSFRFFGASLGNFTKLSLGSLMLRITEIDKFQKKKFSFLKSGEEPNYKILQA
jgi:hypothetical protein